MNNELDFNRKRSWVTVCWNKIINMSPINVILVPLMWPCGVESSVKPKHDLSKEVSVLPCSFFNPLIFLAWQIHLFVTWSGISTLWTMKPGSLNTVLHLADAPSGVSVCVGVHASDVCRLTGWWQHRHFLYEKIACPYPLLCAQVHFNDQLNLINLHEYN